MDDRALLELAAKAAGYTIKGWAGDCPQIRGPDGYTWSWTPLGDNGDALGLAAHLRIPICFPFLLPSGVYAARADTETGEFFEVLGGDAPAATRRAIVRAAAEIGKSI